jgi:hypothetical protein
VSPAENPELYKTWNVMKYPEINPVVPAGFDLGVWKCIVILAAITIAFRFFSMIFLKLLVSKF